MRRTRDCTELYLAHPATLTPALFRNLARETGFLPLIESDDISGCGSSIFWFIALSDGPRRFRAPSGYRPGRVLAGPGYAPAGDGLFETHVQTADIFAVALEKIAKE